MCARFDSAGACHHTWKHSVSNLPDRCTCRSFRLYRSDCIRLPVSFKVWVKSRNDLDRITIRRTTLGRVICEHLRLVTSRHNPNRQHAIIVSKGLCYPSQEKPSPHAIAPRVARRALPATKRHFRRDISFFIARDSNRSEWLTHDVGDTWLGLVASNLRRPASCQYGDPSSQVGRAAGLGRDSSSWWCLVDEIWNPAAHRWAAASSLVALLPALEPDWLREGMRPPKMAAASNIAPGLSLRGFGWVNFLTVSHGDFRRLSDPRRHRRLDVGSGM